MKRLTAPQPGLILWDHQPCALAAEHSASYRGIEFMCFVFLSSVASSSMG